MVDITYIFPDSVQTLFIYISPDSVQRKCADIYISPNSVQKKCADIIYIFPLQGDGLCLYKAAHPHPHENVYSVALLFHSVNSLMLLSAAKHNLTSTMFIVDFLYIYFFFHMQVSRIYLWLSMRVNL